MHTTSPTDLLKIPNLPGAAIVTLPQAVDDRGVSYAALRDSDPFVAGCGERLRQVTVIRSPAAGVIRAYCAHRQQTSYFHCVAGRALFNLWGYLNNEVRVPVIALEREEQLRNAPGQLQTARLTLDAQVPQLLVIPPNLFYGWMSLVPGTLLLVAASQEDREGQPDEVHQPPNRIDLDGGSPWRVLAG
jgi:hypothetical protein